MSYAYDKRATYFSRWPLFFKCSPWPGKSVNCKITLMNSNNKKENCWHKLILCKIVYVARHTRGCSSEYSLICEGEYEVMVELVGSHGYLNFHLCTGMNSCGGSRGCKSTNGMQKHWNQVITKTEFIIVKFKHMHRCT